jgi:NmrA-like family
LGAPRFDSPTGFARFERVKGDVARQLLGYLVAPHGTSRPGGWLAHKHGNAAIRDLGLITGATGTVGREVVQRLSAQTVPVRAVTRDVRRAAANTFPGVQFVQGDFDDAESMQTACAGVERAFLLTNSTERAGQQQIAFTRVAQPSKVRTS